MTNDAGGRAATVSIIGGAGRIGLPTAILLANKGFKVYGVDLNQEAMACVMAGRLPFVEDGAEELLVAALSAGHLSMGSDLSVVRESGTVIVVPGTPVDEHLNPILDSFNSVVAGLVPHLRRGHLVIFRSTIAPGTTDSAVQFIQRETGLVVGENLFVVAAPERVAQGQAIREMVELPQLVGAPDDASYERAAEFFGRFTQSCCIRLSPVEAELGKLMTNMTRYVQFALSNEYYLIADAFGANAHRIIDACNRDYPRMSLPTPGPNVGGPCLYKDGFFLVEHVPFLDLVSSAFKINEGMTMHIVRKLDEEPSIRTVAVLGLTFKAGSDDTRNSLSFKLRKQLLRRGCDVVLVDPYIPEHSDPRAIAGSDCVILMTPHPEFKDLGRIMSLVRRADCLYVDVWGFWDEMRGRSRNGFFRGYEVLESRQLPTSVVASPVTDEIGAPAAMETRAPTTAEQQTI